MCACRKRTIINPPTHTMTDTIITPAEITAATEAAADFIETHGSMGLSDETIALMCFIKLAMPSKARPFLTAAGPTHTVVSIDLIAPGQLQSGLERFAGQRVTAAQFAEGIGMAGAKIAELRRIGSLLRMHCGEPSRSGGRILFTVPGATSAAKPAEKEYDSEDPLRPDMRLGARAVNYAVLHPGDQASVAELASMLGEKASPENTREIGDALTAEGFIWVAEIGGFRFAKPPR